VTRQAAPFWGFSPEAYADKGSDESDEAGLQRLRFSGGTTGLWPRSSDHFPMGISLEFGSFTRVQLFIPIDGEIFASGLNKTSTKRESSPHGHQWALSQQARSDPGLFTKPRCRC